MGGVSEKRMLRSIPCDLERNIRRIGSLQSPNRAPIGEVIGVAVVVSGGLLRTRSDGQETSGSGGSSKHHKLGVFLMTEPIMSSPSSLPSTSNKMLGGEKKEYRKVWTFEYNCSLGNPDVAKDPFLFGSFEKHPTRRARVISENTDVLLLKSGLDWVHSELTHVYICRCREVFVEMRIILEGQTSFIHVTAEIPQNFLHIRHI